MKFITTTRKESGQILWGIGLAIHPMYTAGRDMVVPAYGDKKEIIDVNITRIDGQYLGRVPLSVKVVPE